MFKEVRLYVGILIMIVLSCAGIGMIGFDNNVYADESDFTISNGVLTAYSGEDEAVVIPDGVTEIAEEAFYGNEEIKSVYIPDGVTNIQDFAFRFCFYLESVRLPKKLETINPGTFQYCRNLKEIEWPATLNKIGKYAFYECQRMKNVYLPDSVTQIENDVFGKMESLETVRIPKNVTSIGDSIINTKNVCIVGAAGSVAEEYAKSSEIQFAVEGQEVSFQITQKGSGSWKVKDGSRELKDGDTVKIGDIIYITTASDTGQQIVTINGFDLTRAYYYRGDGVVEQFSCLKSLSERAYIIKEDTKIDIQYIEIPSLDASLNVVGGTLKFSSLGEREYVSDVYMGRTVARCSEDNVSKKAILSTTVTGAGYIIFDYWTSRSSGDQVYMMVDGEIVKPLLSVDGVNADPNYVGDGWQNASFYVGEGEHTISWVFDRTYADLCLDNIQFTADASKVPIESIDVEERFDIKINENIPMNVQLVPSYAAGKICTYESSDESVATVKNGVLTGVSTGKAVITVTCEGVTRKCTVYVGAVTKQGDFDVCGTILVGYRGNDKVVNIPKGITEIAEKVFEDCDFINKVTFPDSLEKIDAYAFSNCDGLTEITIPEYVTYVGRNAFSYCNNLKTVTLGKGVEKLEHFTFYKNSAFQKISIPNTVESIDEYVFSKNKELAIYCEKDSAAYTYAIQKGFHYCLVDGEILGESFNFDDYIGISKEEVVSTNIDLSAEVIVQDDTEYTYFISGKSLYRYDIARNVFDSEPVLTLDFTINKYYVRGSTIFFMKSSGSETEIVGYNVFKSQLVFDQIYPIGNIFTQFVVDKDDFVYFIKNGSDMYIYAKDGSLSECEINSTADWNIYTSSVTLNGISSDGNILFINTYGIRTPLKYPEDYEFSSFSEAINYPYPYAYYDAYRVIRNGKLVDHNFYIKNPTRYVKATWKFYDNEKYGINQFGEIASFDFHSDLSTGFNYTIDYIVGKNGEVSSNVSTYLDGIIYAYSYDGTIIAYDAVNSSVIGTYTMETGITVDQIYTADKNVYVRYTKDSKSYIVPLDQINYKEKYTITRTNHVTLSYAKESVVENYLNSLPETEIESSDFYSEIPSKDAPYKAGVLSDKLVSATLDRLNYARWQAGLNPLSIKSEYMERSQKGAVLLAHLKQLTHYPSQPSDMDDDFYKDAYAGVNASVEYSGNCAVDTSLVSAVFGYLDDDNNIGGGIGHRLSLLDQTADGVSFGQCERYSDMSIYYASDESKLGNDESYYAWPSAGYFPSEGISVNAMWHISTDWQFRKNVKVTFTTENGTYTAEEIYYDDTYKAYYFSIPQELKNELSNNGSYFLCGKAVTVTMEGLQDDKGNDIIITYPVTFVATDAKSYSSSAQISDGHHDYQISESDDEKTKYVCPGCGKSKTIWNIEHATVSGIESSYLWSATGVRPEPVVTLSGVKLEKNKDYTVSYSNTMREGNAVLTITGKGNYKGIITCEYTITKIEVNNPTITVLTDIAPEESELETWLQDDVTIEYEGKKLTYGTDYKLGYYNINKKEELSSVQIVYIGSYTGYSYLYNITMYNLSDIDIQEYTGKPVTPKIEVYYWLETLCEGVHYKVSYSNNTDIGTAAIKITGIGDYFGSQVKEFEIRKLKDISNATISGLKEKYLYNDYGVTPEPIVTLEGKELVLDKDYTLSYSNNMNTGSDAKVIITGKGEYKGRVEKTFEICRVDATDAKITYLSTEIPNINNVYEWLENNVKFEVDGEQLTYQRDYVCLGYSVMSDGNDISSIELRFTGGYTGFYNLYNIQMSDVDDIEYMAYTGKAITPKNELTFWNSILVKDVSYKVTYSNNVNRGTATITYTGIDNFFGSIVDHFIIADEDKIPITAHYVRGVGGIISYYDEASQRWMCQFVWEDGEKCTGFLSDGVRIYSVDLGCNVVWSGKKCAFVLEKDYIGGDKDVTKKQTNEKTTTINNTSASKPGKAKIVKAVKKSKSSKKIKVYLKKKVLGAKGYQTRIYKTKKQAKSNRKAVVIKNTTKLTFTIKSSKMKGKKILYVRVRAYKKVGNIKVYGKWSAIKKTTRK